MIIGIYISEFLDIRVLEIKIKKCKVYNAPNKRGNEYLKKGDIVIIIEEKGEWIKVEYGNEKQGWIKCKFQFNYIPLFQLN